MTDDIIRKATTADYIETIDNLRAEVERLRSEIMQPVETFGTPELVAWIEELHHMVMDFPESERGQIPFVMGMGELLTRGMKSWTAAKDARIDLLDSDQKRYHAAWMAAEEDKEEQAARIRELEAEVEAKNKQIKELQDIIDKPPEEADWVADYHLLQSALDGPIIDAARKWHAAYRKAQNSNLMRAKEVERLRSVPAWEVTEERIAAMKDACNFLVYAEIRNKGVNSGNVDRAKNAEDVLRAMLEEAEHGTKNRR